MLPRLTRRSLLNAGLAAGALAALPRLAAAQTETAPLTEGPELYPGERALAEAAAKEGVVISANTALGWYDALRFASVSGRA